MIVDPPIVERRSVGGHVIVALIGLLPQQINLFLRHELLQTPNLRRTDASTELGAESKSSTILMIIPVIWRDPVVRTEHLHARWPEDFGVAAFGGRAHDWVLPIEIIQSLYVDGSSFMVWPIIAADQESEDAGVCLQHCSFMAHRKVGRAVVIVIPQSGGDLVVI